MSGPNQRIRYANQILSREELNRILAEDREYQEAVAKGQEARIQIREAENELEEAERESTTVLESERDCSRLERRVEYLRQALRETKAERDKQRQIASDDRRHFNRDRLKRRNKANIKLKQAQGNFRYALSMQDTRRSTVFKKVYQENFKALREQGAYVGKQPDEEDDGDDDEE